MHSRTALLYLIQSLTGIALLVSSCTPASVATLPPEATATLAPTASPLPATATIPPTETNPIRLLPFTRLPPLTNASDKKAQADWPQHVLFRLPEMDRAQLAADMPFAAQGSAVLRMDLYYPPDYRFQAKLPAVIFPHGFADGGQLPADKDFQQQIDWGMLLAAAGIIAVSGQTGQNPEEAASRVLDFVEAHADQLGIDGERIGLLSFSNHDWPTTSLFERSTYRDSFRAAVFYYGGLSAIPMRWPKNLSLFVVQVHDTVKPEVRDAYVNAARANSVPVEYIVLPEAVHGFDLLQDEPFTRDTIQKTLAFLTDRLLLH